MVAGRPDELNEFSPTEALIPDGQRETREEETSLSEEVEQFVGIDGEPWHNPVFHNSSLDPELFVTIEKPDAAKDATTDRSVVVKHSNKLHHKHSQYHIEGQHYLNSNACFACLAMRGNRTSGEVTSEDSIRKLEQLINGISSDTTTALVVLAIPTTDRPRSPGSIKLNHVLPIIIGVEGVDPTSATEVLSGGATSGERLPQL